jgi:O-antigen/teichoic acid export membrane protein
MSLRAPRSTIARLVAETAQLSVGNFGALAIGLVTTVLVTRALGDEARGIYAWVFTLQGLAAQVATLVTYHAARQLAAKHPVAEWPVLLGTIAILAGVGTLLASPLMLYGMLEANLGQSTQSLQAVAYCVVPVAALAAGSSALLHTQGGWWANMVSIGAQRVVLLVGVLVLLAFGSLTVITITWVNAAAIVLATAATIALLGISPWHWRASMSLARELAGFLGSTWLAMLALFALPKVTILLLGSSGQLAATGHYSVASTLMETALIIPSLAGAVLVTHFTKNQSGEAGRRKVTLAVLAAMVIICGAGAALSPWLIPWVFGASFAAAVAPFQVLMVAVVCAALHQAWMSRLVAAHQRWAVVVPPVIACGVAAGAGAVCVPAYGAMGAAIATVMGYVTLAAITYAMKGKH